MISLLLAPCSICKLTYTGLGHTPHPFAEGRCCSACHDTVVVPLRVARVIARDGALRVAEFALLLARQRAQLSPPGTVQVKDMAMLIATGMINNAIERMSAPPPADAPPHAS
jgi:hypothetical protein